MKGIVITHKGIEDISAKEIKELINSKSEIKDSVCIFNIKKLEDLCLLCYKGQSFIKILYLIDSFKFKDFDDLIKKIGNKNIINEIDKWTKNKTFKLDCKRVGEHSFSSQDIRTKVGKLIDEKTKGTADFENPDLIVYIYVYNNDCYIGIDFAGFDLSKRDYKIFLSPRSLKGTIAYSLIRIADYKTNEILLDPFCADGIIAIEAALFASNFPVNYYRKDKFQFLKILKYDFDKIDNKIKLDKAKIIAYDSLLRNVNAAKKNAKIAGIQKQIKFARADIGWLDTKIDKESIDKIITNPPVITKINEKQMIKLYNEFFYQCNFILKKKGKIILITKNKKEIKEIAEKNNFKIEKSITVEAGKEHLNILVISKV